MSSSQTAVCPKLRSPLLSFVPNETRSHDNILYVSRNLAGNEHPRVPPMLAVSHPTTPHRVQLVVPLVPQVCPKRIFNRSMQVSHGTMGIGVGERLYRWVLMDLTSVPIQSTIGTLDLTTYFAPPLQATRVHGLDS